MHESVACARSHRASEAITPPRKSRSFSIAARGTVRSSTARSSGYDAEVKKTASTHVAMASTPPGSAAAAAVSAATARAESERRRLSMSLTVCINCSRRYRLSHAEPDAPEPSSRERRPSAASGSASKNAGAAASSAFNCEKRVVPRSDRSPPSRKSSVSVRRSAEKPRRKRRARCKCSTTGSSSAATSSASKNGRHHGRR